MSEPSVARRPKTAAKFAIPFGARRRATNARARPASAARTKCSEKKDSSRVPITPTSGRRGNSAPTTENRTGTEIRSAATVSADVFAFVPGFIGAKDKGELALRPLSPKKLDCGREALKKQQSHHPDA